MRTLTKNQLAYLLSSVAPSETRPTLQYIYYIADKKVAVSTDAFQLHEIHVDLGDEDLIIDREGYHKKPELYNDFPQYESFFPVNPSHKFKTTLNQANIKMLRDIAKVSLQNFQVTLENGIVQSYEPSRYKNLETLNFSAKIYKSLPEHNNPPQIGFNVDFLYNHSRYIDKPHFTTISIDTPLSPITLESFIDGSPTRTLIMPLKI